MSLSDSLIEFNDDSARSKQQLQRVLMKHSFQNFQVDHMTLLLQPQLYKVAYVVFQIIFGCGPENLIYEKRKEWQPGQGEQSMTFAMCIGDADQLEKSEAGVQKTIVAVVQPTEPTKQSSHVRDMLKNLNAAAHWQHIALRTPDLLAFHKHALERGMQFITPILKDDEDNLIQVFSGEWFFPGMQPSGMFFEFLQRNPTEAHLKAMEGQNRELWFRDQTFLGLYGEKETEYQSGKVTPFISFEMFERIQKEIGDKNLWEINQADIDRIEAMMMENAKKSSKAQKVAR